MRRPARRQALSHRAASSGGCQFAIQSDQLSRRFRPDQRDGDLSRTCVRIESEKSEPSVRDLTSFLRKEWDAIRTPAVASFRDAAGPFKSTSLFYDGSENDEWYQGWNDQRPRPHGSARFFCMHHPIRAALVECLARYGLPDKDVMNEFYFHFYKMRNAKDNGSAFYEPPWIRYQELGWYNDIDQDHSDLHREWAEAHLLYSTFAGRHGFDERQRRSRLGSRRRATDVSPVAIFLELRRTVCDLLPRPSRTGILPLGRHSLSRVGSP